MMMIMTWRDAINEWTHNPHKLLAFLFENMLEAGFNISEPFSIKAADGKITLYGTKDADPPEKKGKEKCKNCGTSGDIIEGSHPKGWFTIEVFEHEGCCGRGKLNKTVCSKECALEIMHKTAL